MTPISCIFPFISHLLAHADPPFLLQPRGDPVCHLAEVFRERQLHVLLVQNPQPEQAVEQHLRVARVQHLPQQVAKRPLVHAQLSLEQTENPLVPPRLLQKPKKGVELLLSPVPVQVENEVLAPQCEYAVLLCARKRLRLLLVFLFHLYFNITAIVPPGPTTSGAFHFHRPASAFLCFAQFDVHQVPSFPPHAQRLRRARDVEAGAEVPVREQLLEAGVRQFVYVVQIQQIEQLRGLVRRKQQLPHARVDEAVALQHLELTPHAQHSTPHVLRHVVPRLYFEVEFGEQSVFVVGQLAQCEHCVFRPEALPGRARISLVPLAVAKRGPFAVADAAPCFRGRPALLPRQRHRFPPDRALRRYSVHRADVDRAPPRARHRAVALQQVLRQVRHGERAGLLRNPHAAPELHQLLQREEVGRRLPQHVKKQSHGAGHVYFPLALVGDVVVGGVRRMIGHLAVVEATQNLLEVRDRDLASTRGAHEQVREIGVPLEKLEKNASTRAAAEKSARRVWGAHLGQARSRQTRRNPPSWRGLVPALLRSTRAKVAVTAMPMLLTHNQRN
mmetsp:Transcript_14952/g.37272  ORF Transcript_14952/g.37272 Transcript_14952/m.37272 type:complete len:559 (-) Transcript_14952:9-1685(-)